MMPVIHSIAVYENATPAKLYALFMDSAKHSAATGMPAKIGKKVGAKWTAFSGMLLGKNLEIIPNRRIVQSWRSSEWKKKDPDSVLVLNFEKSASGGAQVDLVHVGVPEYDHEGVTNGWVKFYWEPWRKYLDARKR